MESLKDYSLKDQLYIINKIIKAIENGEFYNAFILIRYHLNDKSYYWYKDIKNIIDNQISNLFYDIENNQVNGGLCLTFFKRQALKLENLINQLE